MIDTLLRDVSPAVMLVGCCFLVFAMASCSEQPEQAEAPLTPPANSNQALLNALEGHTETIILGDSDGPQIVLTPEISARVLGAAIDGANDENLMWVDETVLDGSIWDTDPMFWNFGGLRTWTAPEDLFFVNAEKDADSWFVPKSLDPAPFETVSVSATEASFKADMDLPANIGKTYSITIARTIKLLTEPPADSGKLSSAIEYMGLEKIHSLTNRSDLVIGEDLPYICLWSLLQINPAGTTMVPVKEGVDPKWAYREYFNPLGDRLSIADNIISIKIDGKYRLKIGIRPEAAGEGLAYLRDNEDGTGILFIKEFPVDPEGIYVDKPWGKPSDYGDAIELYNDDGNMGGFTEIECHGPAQRLEKGASQSHTLTLHMFRGPLEELKAVASSVLGTDLSNAVYY